MDIIMKRFGSVRQKTIHTKKVKLKDGFHFIYEHLNCPHNTSWVCQCIILNDSINVKYCFCG